MRRGLEAWLQSRWYGSRRPGWLLRGLGVIQRGLVSLNRRRARRAWRAPVPVVVVGNLTVGGSGKTPFITWLAGELSSRGLSVGIVSRGYGRRERAERLVEPDSDWRDVGDEPLLLRRITGCPVAVGADRAAACRLLLGRASPDIILSDDGLQHYALHRDREIVVIDGHRGFGNGHLIPAGPLREPLWRLTEVDWRVWNGERPAGEDGLLMRAGIDTACNLADGRPEPLSSLAPGPVRAVAGIGDPARFFGSLEALGIRIEADAPGDHGVWQPQADESLPVLMTEKDAVKLDTAPGRDWWSVPLSVSVDDGTPLIDDLLSLVPGDRRTVSIHHRNKQ